MNLRKINFRQPKYIFPLVLAVPAGCLLYILSDLFTGSMEEAPSDYINTNLPDAKLSKQKDKMNSMQGRYSKDNVFSAIGGLDKEVEEKEYLDNEYSEEELQKIMEETEAIRQQKEEALLIEKNIKDSQNRLSDRYSSNNSRSRQTYEDFDEAYESVQRKQQERVKKLLEEPDKDELARAEANRLARLKEQQEKENAPIEVIKASSLTHVNFNTVNNSDEDGLDSPLIKAMIDKTTKSTDGTRLRFKLLDDVVVNDVKLLKGSYLYGTVSGFGTQRVKANISTILVGDRFLKVNLNVYDLDGMEGFYVPASAFREFMQNAAAGVAGQSIQFNNNSGSSDGINAEAIALQALQNIYSAGSNAISRNLKKNKAKIKYNTIVYLINAKNVQ